MLLSPTRATCIAHHIIIIIIDMIAQILFSEEYRAEEYTGIQLWERIFLSN